MVAVGIGVGQVLDRVSRGSSADSSASAPEAARDAGGDTPDNGLSAGGAEAFAGQDLPSIRSQRFEKDVRDLQVTRQYLAQDGIDTGGTANAPGASAPQTSSERATAGCRLRAWGSGTLVPVEYDGVPAVLVLRAPRGDTQVADLYLCGDPDPVRSITLPAP